MYMYCKILKQQQMIFIEIIMTASVNGSKGVLFNYKKINKSSEQK